MPPTNPQKLALAIHRQAEGLATMRYRYDVVEGKPKVGGSMKPIELAWLNLFDGHVQRARLANGGVLAKEDIRVGKKGRAALARADMLSISGGGIYVCPHASCDDRLYFVTPRGRPVSLIPSRWPARDTNGRLLQADGFFHNVQGRHVQLAVVGKRAALIRMRRTSALPVIDGIGIFPTTARMGNYNLSTGWAFLGSDAVGYAVTIGHAKLPAGFATVLQLGADDQLAQVVSAPTQLDLTDPPRACSPADRAKSFRIVAPPLAQTRRPVIVKLLDGQLVSLTTGQAVLYAGNDSGCASIFDAAGGRKSPLRAIIPTSDLDHAWLFDRVSGGVRWRSMQCRFDPNPPALPTSKTTSGVEKLDASTCEKVFDRMVEVLGGSLQLVRKQWVNMCLEAPPVDKNALLRCVQSAKTAQELVSKCGDLMKRTK
jgi:hypothetical protein